MTGPDSAEKGILSIYDIFGYFDQTIQGADILATSGTQKYKVFMPDWCVNAENPSRKILAVS